jgi:hypothetical protein
VIVCSLVITYPFPIESLWSGLGFRITIQNFLITPFGLRPVFIHESNSRQSELELRPELVSRQIAFQSRTFFSVCIEQQYGWGPNRIEAMEISGVLFDVGLKWDEVVVNK